MKDATERLFLIWNGKEFQSTGVDFTRDLGLNLRLWSEILSKNC